MTESELMPSTSSWFQSKFNQKNDTYKLKRSVVLIHMYVCTGDASATKIDSFSQIKKKLDTYKLKQTVMLFHVYIEKMQVVSTIY